MTYPGQLQQVPQRTQANLLLPDFDSIPGEYSPGRGKGKILLQRTRTCVNIFDVIGDLFF
jgi:hypothetical protein